MNWSQLLLSLVVVTGELVVVLLVGLVLLPVVKWPKSPNREPMVESQLVELALLPVADVPGAGAVPPPTGVWVEDLALKYL